MLPDYVRSLAGARDDCLVSSTEATTPKQFATGRGYKNRSTASYVQVNVKSDAVA